MNAAALVVGIDHYDWSQIPQLTGCVDNALKTAIWLVATGVPPDRIWLNLSPISGRTVSKPDAAMTLTLDARATAIWTKSVFPLSALSGEQLYVFFCGHGLWVPKAGAVFLAQDYGAANLYDRTLALNAYCDYFQSLKFAKQLVVCDACEDYGGVNPIYQTPTVASEPPVGNYVPNPNNAVILTCAASQGQRALAPGGRSLFTPTLLSILGLFRDGRPPRGFEDVLQHDWKTGTRSFNFFSAFKAVANEVTELASRAGGVQTPWLQPRGRPILGTDTIIPLAAAPSAPVSVEVEPGSPSLGVDEVRLGGRTIYPELVLPLSGVQPGFPHHCVAPQGRALDARCWPQAGWVGNPPMTTVNVAGALLKIVFTFSPAPPPPPPPPPLPGHALETDVFNLQAVSFAGRNAAPPLAFAEYGALPSPPNAVSLIPHEDGPEIAFEPSELKQAADYAIRVQASLNQALRNQPFEIMLSPPGRMIDEDRPNMRLGLPAGGATALAGFLADLPVLGLERMGGRDEPSRPPLLALSTLETQSMRRVELGTWRISVDLPWGGWRTSEVVEPSGMTVCELPPRIGLPPLRHAFAPGTPPRYSSSVERVAGYDPIERDGARSPNAPGLAIEFAVTGSAETMRAEPFSNTRMREWDDLIGVGRLDAVPPARVKTLIDGLPVGAFDTEGETALFRLALAYAARAFGEQQWVVKALSQLPESLRHGPDACLLTGEELPTDSWPLFRWGAELWRRRESAPALVMPSPRSAWAVYLPITVEASVLTR